MSKALAVLAAVPCIESAGCENKPRKKHKSCSTSLFCRRSWKSLKSLKHMLDCHPSLASDPIAYKSRAEGKAILREDAAKWVCSRVS